MAGGEERDDESVLVRDLRACALDGICFSLMVGLGESYFAAFTLANGASQVLAGLVASVPMVFGALLQLAAPWGVRHLGSYRRWVVLCAALQALSFLPLVAGALFGGVRPWIVFAIAALYWGSGMSTGPAWNTWIGTVVPRGIRPRFFAWRTRAVHVASFAGLLVGGLTLQLGDARGGLMLAFAAIFAAAGLSRGVSARFLAMQSETRTRPDLARRVPIGDFLRRMRSRPDGRLLAYMLTVQVSVYVGAPFFTPYMLQQLHLDYAAYMGLIATAMLGKALALPLLGRLARARGVLPVLWLGGIGLVPNAALWLVSDNWFWLAGAQFYSGIVWSAFELATLLLLFESVDEHERTSLLTTHNLGHAGAVLTGSLFGGALLFTLGQDKQAYLWVFAATCLARALTLPFLRRIKDLGKPVVPLTTRTVAVRPAAGTIDRPVLPGISEEDAAASETGPRVS